MPPLSLDIETDARILAKNRNHAMLYGMDINTKEFESILAKTYNKYVNFDIDNPSGLSKKELMGCCTDLQVILNEMLEENEALKAQVEKLITDNRESGLEDEAYLAGVDRVVDKLIARLS